MLHERGEVGNGLDGLAEAHFCKQTLPRGSCMYVDVPGLYVDVPGS